MTATTNKQILRPFYTEYAADPTGWTTPINGNWDIIDSAFGGTHTVSLTNANVTLTDTQCQNVRIKLTGAITANITIFFPAAISGLFVVNNATTGAFVITLASAGAGAESVTAVQSVNTLIWLDAVTNSVYLADNSPVIGGIGITVNGSTIDLDVPVTVPNGGTGQTAYTQGQLLIGNTAGGLTPATLTNGSNISIVNGNGTITISATGSAGGVTTVSGGTTGLTPNVPTAGDVVLSGTLGVPNGGTGAATLTGYVKGTGVTAMTASATVPGTDLSGAYTAAALTMATNRLLGRSTASTGAAEEITLGTGLSFTGTTLNVGGVVTTFSGGTTGLTPNTATSGAVTLTGTLGAANGGTGATTLTGYVKGTGVGVMTASATVPGSELSGAYTAAALTIASNRLLGRVSASTGAVEEITLGTNLTFSGGALNATGGGVTSVSASSSASGFSLTSSGSTAITVTYGISDTSLARTSLGLGSMATQNANNVAITGGTISGVSLGLGTMSTQNANAVAITGGTISGATSIASTGTITGDRFEIIGGQPSITFSGGLGVLNLSTTSSFTGTNSELKCFVGGIENFKCTTTAFTLSSAITSAQCFFGTTWTNISDARIKTDITSYNLGTSALNQLRPVTYIYNGDYGSPDNGIVQTGLIAQEVLTTPLASMVGTRVYTDPDTGVETTLYDLNTNQLVFALINAVKELSTRVAALEAK